MSSGVGKLHDAGDVFAGPVADPECHLDSVQGQVGGIRSNIHHPTIRREWTSLTKAMNAISDPVGTQVKLTTQSRFGRLALKQR